jgi:hypothetical protein|tara:strand:+ start:1627 stop:1962 length:336 start_codon:yes stop_codon:yes gene_type:complete
MYNEPSEYDYRAPTHRELVDNYTRCHGEFETERAWILSPYDTWEPNPCYTGRPQHHPDHLDMMYDLCVEAGDDPDTISIYVDGLPADPPRQDDVDLAGDIGDRLERQTPFF